MIAVQENPEETVRQYADMLYRVALSHTGNRYDAEEAFQEAFLAYFRKNPECRDEEHRKAWLLRTVIVCSRRIRAKAHAHEALPLEEAIGETAPVLPEEEAVWSALLSLPEKYRVPLQLFLVEEMSGAEIAAALGLREAAVRKRISRGKEKLRTLLKGEERIERDL